MVLVVSSHCGCHVKQYSPEQYAYNNIIMRILADTGGYWHYHSVTSVSDTLYSGVVVATQQSADSRQQCTGGMEASEVMCDIERGR